MNVSATVHMFISYLLTNKHMYCCADVHS